MDLETDGWRPYDYGMAADARTLGVMLCLKQIALRYAQ
jgi:hypothetical protein